MSALALRDKPDTVRLRVALGIRLRDIATGRFVGEGPSVSVARDVANARSYALEAVPSAHWVNQEFSSRFRELPEDRDDWPPLARDHAIAIDDASGQYLPLRLKGKLPCPDTFAWDGWPVLAPAQLGPLLAPGETPDPPPAHLPLFPASAYAAGPLARVHAHLAFYKDEDTITDAAWALMSVSLAGKVIGIGLSDARGAIGVYFPYPLIPDLTPQQKVQGRPVVKWPVTIAVHAKPLPAGELPDLKDILAQLGIPARLIHATLASPSAPLGSQDLILGQPLVLRTAIDATRKASSLYLKAT